MASCRQSRNCLKLTVLNRLLEKASTRERISFSEGLGISALSVVFNCLLVMCPFFVESKYWKTSWKSAISSMENNECACLYVRGYNTRISTSIRKPKHLENLKIQSYLTKYIKANSSWFLSLLLSYLNSKGYSTQKLTVSHVSLKVTTTDKKTDWQMSYQVSLISTPPENKSV